MKISKSILALLVCWPLLALCCRQAVAQSGTVHIPSAHFTQPGTLMKGEADASLIDTAIELVQNTPPGEEITICAFKLNRGDLLEALAAARRRGVLVRLILNDGDTSNESNERTDDRLKDQYEHYHYIENDISGKAIIHNKFVLFSAVHVGERLVRHVVLQTSSNFDEKATHRLQDMVVLHDQQLYHAYLDYWYSMMVLGKADKLEHFDFFEMTTDDGRHKAWFYPKRKNEEELDGDEVVNALEEIKEAAGCTISFAHSKWDEDRMDVVEALEQLIEDGAQIEIVTSDDNDKDVLEALVALDANVNVLDKNDLHLHTKFFLLEYPEHGGRRQYVFTGSHNLTERSLYKNFEVLLRLEDPSLFDAYRQYFVQLTKAHP